MAMNMYQHPGVLNLNNSANTLYSVYSVYLATKTSQQKSTRTNIGAVFLHVVLGSVCISDK